MFLMITLLNRVNKMLYLNCCYKYLYSRLALELITIRHIVFGIGIHVVLICDTHNKYVTHCIWLWSTDRPSQFIKTLVQLYKFFMNNQPISIKLTIIQSFFIILSYKANLVFQVLEHHILTVHYLTNKWGENSISIFDWSKSHPL